jgi:Mg-chelatase subunit ChlD
MRLRIAIVTALAALVAAVPASASGTLQLQKVDTSAFPTGRVTVQSPTPGKAPDLQVFENGAQVPPANVQMVDPGAPAAIAVVIDTSNSMAGAKLNDAIAAAHGFVSAQKNGNLLGVYGFDSTAYPAARLSPDRTEIDTAISQLGTGGAPGTALYGAVKLASEDLQTAPAQRRVMILITDGSSQSDTATLDEAIAAAKQAGVLVYTVGIATSGPAQAALNQIATDTGGTATSVTDSSALAGIYSTIESELRNKVFTNLPQWFEEKRGYHRKDGRIVDKRDDILKATFYAVMMKRYAMAPDSYQVRRSHAPQNPIASARI